MQIGRTSSRFERKRVRTCQDPGRPSTTPVTTLCRHSPEHRSSSATTSPTSGLDSPLTIAPQAFPTGRGRPIRRCSGPSGHSSTLARKAGKSSRKSSREPPKEMNQMYQVMMSWQYSQNPVRWFAVVSSSGG